jgi:C4-dicarboxylate transporter, DctM subunit
MELLSSFLLLMLLMIVLLALGVWVAGSLIMVGLIGLFFFSNVPIGDVLSTSFWSSTANWPLTALPLFIWMGEILYRTNLAADMFRGLQPWIGALPGRLLHVNVFACGIFAAVSGSSAATAATIGQMTLPELKRRGYPQSPSLGSLAAGGTLGILIPPSIPLIVYGVAGQVSIAKLFLAGALPGLILIVMFSAYTAGWAIVFRSKMPPPEPRTSLLEKLAASPRLIPVVLLIVTVIGSIYSGFATPTEAAAVGVVGSFVIAAVSGSLNRAALLASISGTVKITCMITFILAAASFLSTALAFLQMPAALATYVTALELSPAMLLLALALLFIFLGCFIDGISMVVLTAAIVLPIVQVAGIDLVWFGIFLVVMVEMANITPPVGFNLFVIQGITKRDAFDVAMDALPYFLIMAVFAVLITAFPRIVTELPNMAFQ